MIEVTLELGKLTVESWSIGEVRDFYNNKCQVKVLLKTKEMVYHWWIPELMHYEDTWEDKDVEAFIAQKLKERA